MKRGLALLMVAVLLAPTATAQGEIIPGEYPEPIRESVGEILDDAEEEAPGDAQRYLERSRTELDAGNVSMALENYVFYRVTAAEAALAADLEGDGASTGQDIVDRRLERFETEGRATASLAEDVLDEIELQNLTTQGLDTALWGSYLVAQGRMQLNMHDTEVDRNVYSGGSLDRGQLGNRIAAAHGGMVLATLGLEIASRAEQVDGDPLDPEKAHERLSDTANATVTTRGGAPGYLPQGVPEDSALVRTGLFLVTMVEVKAPEFLRIFGPESNPQTLASMQDAFQFDRNRLGPYAEAGFPLAQAGFEAIAFLGPEQLEDPARPPPQRAHAEAYSISEIHKSVFPNATEETEDGIPSAGVLAALAALGAAAVAVRRRPS